TSGASGSMFSPGLTSTSITATSLKLPMSGTRTSTRRAAAFMEIEPSDFPGNGLRRIDAERLHRRGDGGGLELTLVGERFQGGDGDVVTVDLEVPAQRRAGIGAAEPIGAEADITAGHPLANLVGHRAQVVGRGDERALRILQALLHVRRACLVTGVQQIPTLALERLAAQLTEARDGEDVGAHAVLRFEDRRCSVPAPSCGSAWR